MKTKSFANLVVMACMSVAVHTLYRVDARTDVGANLEAGETDIGVEEPAVVYGRSLGGFYGPTLLGAQVLWSSPPQSSLSLINNHYD